jgi:hypothetical protein
MTLDPTRGHRLIDGVAAAAGLLVTILGRLGEAAARDAQDPDPNGPGALADLGVTLAQVGRFLDDAPTYWVADEPVVRGGFVPCVCVPEYILRLAWRAWCLALVVAGDQATAINPLTPDRVSADGDGSLDVSQLVPDNGRILLRLRWPLVRLALRRLPLGNGEEMAAHLHIEHVQTRGAATARLQAGPGPSIQHRLRPCVEEYMQAVEMLPEGWVDMTQEARMAALDALVRGPVPSTITEVGTGSRTPSRPVVWYLGERVYRVDGCEPVAVTLQEDAVLRPFVKLPAMDDSTLVAKSGYGHAGKILRELTKKYNGVFAQAIRLPGGKAQGGYYIDLKEAPKPA